MAINRNLSILAQGAGSNQTLTLTNAQANALTVGRQGTTNPVLNVDASTASVVTGLNLKGAAAAGGMALSVTSSGTNENLTINAKGSGTIALNNTATGGVGVGTASPSTTLQVYGANTATRGQFCIDSSDTSARQTFYTSGTFRLGYYATPTEVVWDPQNNQTYKMFGTGGLEVTGKVTASNINSQTGTASPGAVNTWYNTAVVAGLGTGMYFFQATTYTGASWISRIMMVENGNGYLKTVVDGAVSNMEMQYSGSYIQVRNLTYNNYPISWGLTKVA